MKSLSTLTLAILLCMPSSCRKDNIEIIPRTTTTYSIKISGTTYSGNTNFPFEYTVYSPLTNFELTGKLIISQGINGHARDIVLIIGNPSANPLAGSIWFASNTQMYKNAGFGGFTQGAQLDIGSVTVDEGSGMLSVQLTDQNTARTAQLNGFNIKSGYISALVYQILIGSLEITFSNQGAVNGAFDFVGSGYIYPGSARIRATLIGQKS